MFGKDDFRGLFHVIEERMTCCVKVCPKVRMLVASIRQFLHDICFGKRLTLAQWMREYIAHH